MANGIYAMWLCFILSYVLHGSTEYHFVL